MTSQRLGTSVGAGVGTVIVVVIIVATAVASSSFSNIFQIETVPLDVFHLRDDFFRSL
jgi:hypothetical protein